MPDSISDGRSRNTAHVDIENRLWVNAKSSSIQHVISSVDQDAYQVSGSATLSSGTVVALHIINNDPNKNMTITYLRHQIIGASGGTDFPNANNWFSARLGRSYSADGSVVLPVNMFGGSGNAAAITTYEGNPTLTGTAFEFDRWYTKADGDMNTYNKEGALIIPPNRTIELSYVGDRTSGIIHTRISFTMESHL